MGKSKRKAKKSPIIILIYLIILGIGCFLTINNYLQIKKYQKDTITQKEKYNKIKNDYHNVLKTNQEFSTELNKLEHMDQTIENTKKEVFDLAKKVETTIQEGNGKVKIAYLTFDDGPYYLTNDVLNTLNEKQVKATFFTIGLGKDSCIDNRKEDCTTIYKKITDNNHTIANHTYSHAIFAGLYSSVDNFIADVQKQETLIYNKTNIKTNIMRFPGGSSTAKNLKEPIITKLREKGYGWVDWTAQDGDGGGLKTKEQAWNTFTKSIDKDIEVVLFHDYNHITYSILPDVIRYLEDNNYILLPLFYDSVMVNK